MTLLHSLVDMFKIINRCHQKEGVILWPQYLSSYVMIEEINICWFPCLFVYFILFLVGVYVYSPPSINVTPISVNPL